MLSIEQVLVITVLYIPAPWKVTVLVDDIPEIAEVILRVSLHLPEAMLIITGPLTPFDLRAESAALMVEKPQLLPQTEYVPDMAVPKAPGAKNNDATIKKDTALIFLIAFSGFNVCFFISE